MKKLITFVLFTLLIPTAIIADNHGPEVFADNWIMIPKAGHADKFEEAMKAHLKYRKENGEKRDWHIYRPVTGGNLDRYIVRSCCDTWAAQDAHVVDAAKYSEHFGENVAPHVEEFMHNLHVIDSKNNNWPEGTEANYVGVTTYTPIVGKGRARSEVIEQMSKMALDNGWSRNWAWTYAVGGDGSWSLATPFKNYAEMAPMEENFYQFAVKHMKSEEAVDAMFAKFQSTFSEANFTIYRHDKAFLVE